MAGWDWAGVVVAPEEPRAEEERSDLSTCPPRRAGGQVEPDLDRRGSPTGGVARTGGQVRTDLAHAGGPDGAPVASGAQAGTAEAGLWPRGSSAAAGPVPRPASEACRYCEGGIGWRGAGGVAFGDGTVAHLSCYEEAELARFRAGAK